MRLSLSGVNGEVKYNLNMVEFMDSLLSETKRMKDGDTLCVYTMNNNSNIITIYLNNDKLVIYNEYFCVEYTLVYHDMSYNYYYVLISSMLKIYE